MITCPHCSNSDDTLLERLRATIHSIWWWCGVCSKPFEIKQTPTDEAGYGPEV